MHVLGGSRISAAEKRTHFGMRSIIIIIIIIIAMTMYMVLSS